MLLFNLVFLTSFQKSTPFILLSRGGGFLIFDLGFPVKNLKTTHHFKTFTMMGGRKTWTNVTKWHPIEKTVRVIQTQWKNNLSKTLDRKARIGNWGERTPYWLCFAICSFSQVISPEPPHAKSFIRCEYVFGANFPMLQKFQISVTLCMLLRVT